LRCRDRRDQLISWGWRNGKTGSSRRRPQSSVGRPHPSIRFLAACGKKNLATGKILTAQADSVVVGYYRVRIRPVRSCQLPLPGWPGGALPECARESGLFSLNKPPGSSWRSEYARARRPPCGPLPGDPIPC
jgi:hypothetical protein